MARRIPPRKVTYFEPGPPRLARNTIESTFEVGRRFRCTLRFDCGQLDPGAVIRAVPGEWHLAHARAEGCSVRIVAGVRPRSSERCALIELEAFGYRSRHN